MKNTLMPPFLRKIILRRAFTATSAVIVISLLFVSPTSSVRAEGPNLILNPSLEQVSTSDSTSPSNWIKDSWGTNTNIFSYVSTGAKDGNRAGQVQITKYTDGDAKWGFDHVTVNPGTTYRFSDYYKSNVSTELVIEYANTSNVLSYISLGELSAATDWTAVSKNFTVPAGIKSATVYHILQSVGILTIDSTSLSVQDSGSGTPPPEPGPTPIPPPETGNLISNPSVENASISPSIPLDWESDSWGTNKATFIYPTAGQEGTKGLRVQMASHTSGDAKWYFKHIPVSPGRTYTFSDYYQSDIPTNVTLEYLSPSGAFSYSELGALGASANWTKYTKTFTVPTNVSAVTVLHHVGKIGYLNTDNFTLFSGTGGDSGSGSTGTGTTGTGGTSTGGIDTVAPNVSLTEPLLNSTHSGTLAMSATATDNIGVSGVIFYIDSVSVGSGMIGTGASNSYGMLFDSTTLANGAHTVYARALDAKGNFGVTANISVNISNPISDTVAPIVSITSPLKGSVLSGTSTLNISATDNVGVSSVHYSITNGTDLISSEFNAAPYSVTIPAEVLKNGSHTITAYAKDAAGNIGNATPVIFNTYYTPPESVNPNLIINPSLESGSGGIPDNWMKGGWGTNVSTFTYPVSGIDGARGAEVSMSTRTDGDVKWYFSDVTVTPGASYVFSDQYKSTTPSTLTARYTATDGTLSYLDIVSNLPASANWISASQTITIPANITKVTIFHLINSIGTLDIDRAELRLSSSGSSGPLGPNAFPTGLVSLTFDDGWGSQYDSALPMLNTAGLKGGFYIITNEMKNAVNANRITNPSFEIADSSSVPSGWTGSKTGNNTANFSYPVAGVSGGKASKVEITSFTSGDAKWQPDDTTVVNEEVYNFTDQYISNVSTKVTVVYTLTNNSTQTFDLGTLPSSGNWSIASFTFTPPVNTKTLTVYHRLMSAGWLTTDDHHLDIAQDYMNVSQVRDIYKTGHEVGPHTKTHPFLTQLTPDQITSEINGSKQDMIDAGFTPSDIFIYPYGDYNQSVIQATKDAGYIGARSVDQGYNTKATNKYALMIQEVNSGTTSAQWESWTQTAMKNHTWLILMFHQIDHQIDEYGATTEELQSYINYIGANGIPVVTLKQGIGMMNP